MPLSVRRQRLRRHFHFGRIDQEIHHGSLVIADGNHLLDLVCARPSAMDRLKSVGSGGYMRNREVAVCVSDREEWMATGREIGRFPGMLGAL